MNTNLPAKLTYWGHATVMIELAGVRLLTDPLLRRRVLHLASTRPAIAPTAVGRVDAVLISHLHFDHMDLPSLHQLGRHVRMIVPRGAGRLLRRQGFTNVEELSVDQQTRVGAVTVTATYAEHGNRRHPLGTYAASIGYHLAAAHTVYFAGDTDLFPAMADIGPNLDVALLPVWGWGPTLCKGHLDPHRAAQALLRLQPRLAAPIHWGSFHPWGMDWFRPAFLTQPPLDFARHAAALAPDVLIQILRSGETLFLADHLPEH